MSTQGRQRLQADVLRQATGSPQGLPVCGPSPEGECSARVAKRHLSGSGGPCEARSGGHQ